MGEISPFYFHVVKCPRVILKWLYGQMRASKRYLQCTHNIQIRRRAWRGGVWCEPVSLIIAQSPFPRPVVVTLFSMQFSC